MDEWVEVTRSTDRTLPDRTLKASKSSDISAKFYAAIDQAAQERLKESKSLVFRVDLGEEAVYTTFLKNLAPELQQEYTCSSCRRFANRYGNLAMVNDDGTLQPLLWCQKDLQKSRRMVDTYTKAVRAVEERFQNAKVTREFKVVTKNRKIGIEKDGRYAHMHLQFPESRVRKEQLSGFTSADTPELAAMLERVLTDYDLNTIREADILLHENKLPYADNHKASSRWLLELVGNNKMGKAKTASARHNLLYRYAASSFIGSLKQMRSGALGTLLEGLKENRPWTTILTSWRNICDPTCYMRPQAAPTQSNINAAERLLVQLGLTKNDLTRRLLIQDDVPEEVVIWSSEIMKDRKKKQTSNGVFAAVKAKAKSVATLLDDAPATTISFSQFVTRVLPKSRRVDCWLGARDTISTCITGFEGNKPLMQWHDQEGKNQASHYLWTSPPRVESHNLKSHAWNEVRCLIPFPNLWDGAPVTTTFPLADPEGEGADKYKYYHKSKGFRYLFVLEENHESRLDVTPLFPEMLKSEFHGVRSTIEAFTKTEPLRDVEDGMMRGGFVAGVEAARSKSDQGLKMRVYGYHGGTTTYKITLFE